MLSTAVELTLAAGGYAWGLFLVQGAPSLAACRELTLTYNHEET